MRFIRSASIPTVLAVSIVACGAAFVARAAPRSVSPQLHDQALEILRKSIGFRTVKGGGQVSRYAAYLKGVLVEAGFPANDIRIEPVGDTAILLARYRGTDKSKKPIVVNGHMDVVEARPQDWQRPSAPAGAESVA